ncbi:hypothetical protein ACFWBN_34190 [Streptomyces sp. NPDC059989]|uniref:hypothetical protein n=1 Tax=Streptomyces sp. NPDC059989 TaxID=3347026 RepID=UPI0036744141
MAMAEAVLALISGLGGAGLGAAGALWSQRAKRRDDAAAASIAAGRAENELLLETVATARAAVRAWRTNAHRALAELEAGRAVDAEQYDAEARADMKEFTEALYRLAGRVQLNGRGAYQRPFADLMTESSRRIIEAAHRHAQAPLSTAEIEALAAGVREVHSEIARHLVRNAEAVTGQVIPPIGYVHPEPPGARMFPAPPPYPPRTP